jgi:hypothetical protein
VDVPPNATERVVGQFGPGPAREVLADLLNGSHFNYVMLGSAANPDGLERVILTARAGGRDASPIAQAPSQPVIANPPPQEPPEEAQDSGDEDFSDDQTVDQAEQPQPDQNQDANQQPDQQQQQPGFPNTQPGVRSPEQLLRELQQRQQQMGLPQGQPPGFPVPPNQQQQPPQ